MVSDTRNTPGIEVCNSVCSLRFRSKMEIVCSHCQESGFVTWSLARTIYYTSLSKCCCKNWTLIFFLDIYRIECSLVLSWSTSTRSSSWMRAGENTQGLSGRASGLPVFGRRAWLLPHDWASAQAKEERLTAGDTHLALPGPFLNISVTGLPQCCVSTVLSNIVVPRRSLKI